jgi:hypothetical protein
LKTLKGRNYFGNLSVDGRIILKLSFRRVWIGLMWNRTKSSGGFF